jgi:hypothetical protein
MAHHSIHAWLERRNLLVERVGLPLPLPLLLPDPRLPLLSLSSSCLNRRWPGAAFSPTWATPSPPSRWCGTLGLRGAAKVGIFVQR